MVPNRMHELLDELPTEEELNEFFGKDSVDYIYGVPAQNHIDVEIVTKFSKEKNIRFVISEPNLTKRGMKQEVLKAILSYKHGSIWVMKDMVRCMRQALPHFYPPGILNSIRFIQEEICELRKEFMIIESGFLRNNSSEGGMKEMGDCILMLLTYAEQIPVENEKIYRPHLQEGLSLGPGYAGILNYCDMAHWQSSSFLSRYQISSGPVPCVDTLAPATLIYQYLLPICNTMNWTPPYCLSLSLENIINKHWRDECGSKVAKAIALCAIGDLAKEAEEWY